MTFEVIRHRLWAINDDQAMIAARLSGSPVVYEALDFNAAHPHRRRARPRTPGSTSSSTPRRSTSSSRRCSRSGAPEGMREGDMFFSNDPWCGALHANDGILASPIFWEGEIVAWSGIVMHDNDVGSPVPRAASSSGPSDRFGEAPLFPAMKMVEDFELRADIERAYLRNHRTPELNALNLRARLASMRSPTAVSTSSSSSTGSRRSRRRRRRSSTTSSGSCASACASMPDGSWCRPDLPRPQRQRRT